MAVKVNAEKCTGCGVCADSCPSEALNLEAGKAAVVAENCTDCGICVSSCPEEAIEQ